MADIPAAVERLKERAYKIISEDFAVKAEKMAKANAPWEDRTRDARKLLKGIPYNREDVNIDIEKKDGDKRMYSRTLTLDRKNSVGFILSHRVEYGKYLEIANSNQYAILKPTIEALRADFFETLKRFFRSKD